MFFCFVLIPEVEPQRVLQLLEGIRGLLQAPIELMNRLNIVIYDSMIY